MIACAFVYDVYLRGSFYFGNASPAEVWMRSHTVRWLVGCVFVGHRQASPSYRTRQLRAVTLVTWYSFVHFIRILFYFAMHLPRRYGSALIRNEG